jgi:hypothetical protein
LIYKLAKKRKKPEFIGNFAVNINGLNRFADEKKTNDCNVNPIGYNETYIQDFKCKLERVKQHILAGKVHYVVFAHGADSHLDDDLGGQCDTEHWLSCASIFGEWVNEVSFQLGKPLPVTLALFGGYRKDDYNIVLDLHLSSIERCRTLLCAPNNAVAA